MTSTARRVPASSWQTRPRSGVDVPMRSTLDPGPEERLKLARKLSGWTGRGRNVRAMLGAMTALPLAPGVRVGPATAGFSVEGGYNGRGQPANNWCWWQAEGRIPGDRRSDFRRRYERLLDRAAAAGCDSFRLSIEWSRCEPLDGKLDDRAIEAYCRVLDACHDRGLQPLVALHHFCHPAWLGVDFWLRPDSPERFRGWVHTAVERFAGRNHHWITVSDVNVYAIRSYLVGSFPPGRRLDVTATMRATDHLLAAHVLAYQAIKERQPQAVVSTGTSALPVYELDRLLLDVLLARSRGVGRHELRRWLSERRARYHEAGLGPTGALDSLLGAHVVSAGALEDALARSVEAVYAGAFPRPLDVVQVGYGDPHLQRRLGGRPAVHNSDPGALARYCQLSQEPGMPVWVFGAGWQGPSGGGDGNGLPGSPERNHDLASLDRHLAAMVDAVKAGLPVTAYYHPALAGGTPGVRDLVDALRGTGRAVSA